MPAQAIVRTIGIADVERFISASGAALAVTPYGDMLIVVCVEVEHDPTAVAIQAATLQSICDADALACRR